MGLSVGSQGRSSSTKSFFPLLAVLLASQWHSYRECKHRPYRIKLKASLRCVFSPNYAAPVFPNEPVEDCAPFSQPFERIDLVSAHEAAVAFHIRCEYCNEASADVHWV